MCAIGHAVDALSVDELDAEKITNILDYLETSQSNSAATCNCVQPSAASSSTFFLSLKPIRIRRSQYLTDAFSFPALSKAGGLHDNCGSALATQLGKS
ncbi:hypothetical protein MPLSOD_410049 [Mesorhizobium sp. SOD10]|nr:hypothetical protein MPLSOD_410049 [Mesorhizobium sp. SOD10]